MQIDLPPARDLLVTLMAFVLYALKTVSGQARAKSSCGYGDSRFRGRISNMQSSTLSRAGLRKAISL